MPVLPNPRSESRLQRAFGVKAEARGLRALIWRAAGAAREDLSWVSTITSTRRIDPLKTDNLEDAFWQFPASNTQDH